jgi:hypothetical protein
MAHNVQVTLESLQNVVTSHGWDVDTSKGQHGLHHKSHKRLLDLRLARRALKYNPQIESCGLRQRVKNFINKCCPHPHVIPQAQLRLDCASTGVVTCAAMCFHKQLSVWAPTMLLMRAL